MQRARNKGESLTNSQVESREFVVFVVLVLWMTSPFTLIYFLDFPGLSWPATTVIAMALFAPIRDALNRYLFGSSQAKRQDDANAIVDILIHGKVGQLPDLYFLFLRGTRSDSIELEWYTRQPGRNTLENGKRFDDEIALALNEDCLLLGLYPSRAQSLIGAAKIETSDANWRFVVQRLAAESFGIVMIPGSSEGAMEEAVLLLSNEVLLAKTVWLMPPGDYLGPWNLARQLAWERSAEAVRSRTGYELPAFRSEGLLFSLDPVTRQPHRWIEIAGGIHDRDGLRSALIFLVAHGFQPEKNGRIDLKSIAGLRVVKKVIHTD